MLLGFCAFGQKNSKDFKVGPTMHLPTINSNPCAFVPLRLCIRFLHFLSHVDVGFLTLKLSFLGTFRGGHFKLSMGSILSVCIEKLSLWDTLRGGHFKLDMRSNVSVCKSRGTM